MPFIFYPDQPNQNPQGQQYPAQYPQYPGQFPMNPNYPGQVYPMNPGYPGQFPQGGGWPGQQFPMNPQGKEIEIPVRLIPSAGASMNPPMMPMGYPPPPPKPQRNGMGMLDVLMVFFGAACIAILLVAALGSGI